ncbi:MAG: hypothetical protein AAFR38_08905 [Planctomycetota bacterium]
MTRSALILAATAGLASAQSASVQLMPASPTAAPGETVSVEILVSYDAGGASGGIFGGGLYGFGVDVSSGSSDGALANPGVSDSLLAGSTTQLTPSDLRIGGTVGLMPPVIEMPPFSVASFDVQVGAGAAIGSTISLSATGGVIVAVASDLAVFSSNPGPGQSQLAPIAASIMVEEANPGCNQFDLVEPFGVISQADVAEFLSLFFANSPIVAVYAAPENVVSQADVAAFVDGFFAGCPTQ